MLARIFCVALAAVASTPAFAVRDPQLVQACRDTIGKAGYADYEFGKSKVVHPDASGIAVIGQAAKEGKLIEFNCVFDSELNVKDTAIKPLAGGGSPTVTDSSGAMVAPDSGKVVSADDMTAFCKGSCQRARPKPCRLEDGQDCKRLSQQRLDGAWLDR